MTAEVFTPSDVTVTMTPSAVRHVRKQLDKKPDAKGIPVSYTHLTLPTTPYV